MQLFDGHYTITTTYRDEDCDHGPCTAYYIAEIMLTVYLYDNDPTRISFQEDEDARD